MDYTYGKKAMCLDTMDIMHPMFKVISIMSMIMLIVAAAALMAPDKVKCRLFLAWDILVLVITVDKLLTNTMIYGFWWPGDSKGGFKATSVPDYHRHFNPQRIRSPGKQI